MQYIVEVGFNEELVKNGMKGGTMLEEIYIVVVTDRRGLGSESESTIKLSKFKRFLSEYQRAKREAKLLKALGQLLSPFPAYFEFERLDNKDELCQFEQQRIPIFDRRGRLQSWSEVARSAWGLIPYRDSLVEPEGDVALIYRYVEYS